MSFFTAFDFQQFLSAFLVIFAAIDCIGSIPTILSTKRRGSYINTNKAAFLSTIMLFGFFYIGEAFLSLFHLDISSFAVAGSLVVFLIGLEMILDVEIFKSGGPSNTKDATFIPIVFPLLTGAGVLTTLLSIRSQYSDINMFFAMIANVVVIYFVLRFVEKIEALLGKSVIYMLQKFFGIILIAMAAKLFITNVTILISKTAGI